MWSTVIIVRNRLLSLNTNQKDTLEDVIRKKKKNQGCNSQKHETLRLLFAINFY